MQTQQLQKSARQRLQQEMSKKICANSDTKNDITYSTLPGISGIRQKIDKNFVMPLVSDNSNMCKKLILRGNTGTGKTFLINAVCTEYGYTAIKTTADDFLENLQRAKLNKKAMLHITDLDKVDESKIDMICCYLEKYSNIFVVAETRQEVDKRLTKYGCFENEIVFAMLNENDRTEILDYLHNKHTKQEIDTKNEYMQEIAKYLPGCTASDICKYFRNVACNADTNMLTKETYKQTLSEMNVRMHDFTFESIGGLEQVKNELYNSIVMPMLHAEKYKKYGLYSACGILLYGPPGCGKTLLAKAVSSLGHCNFVSVKGPELISKFVGDTEKELRDIFARAKQLQPCVIFFDEIDSLCQKRNNTGFNDRIVNQILTLMDGFDSKESVYVLGVTNKLEYIDEAFLRPGRFDKIIHVPLPSKQEQKAIFYKCTENIESDCKIEYSYDCTGFNSADICGMVREAKMMFLTSNIHENNKKIDQTYFDSAYKKVKMQKDMLQAKSD